MNPTIGRIVHYKLSAHDAEAINRRRVTFSAPPEGWPTGAQAHSGNTVYAEDIFPAIITRVWPAGDMVQLQVFLDGNDTYWGSSRREGQAGGEWAWPDRS